MNYLRRRSMFTAIKNEGDDTMREMQFIGEVDFSADDMGQSNKRKTFALSEATEIFLEWTDMTNGTSSASSVIVQINGVEPCGNLVRTNKTGSTHNGWTELYYNGIAWIPLSSKGATAATNYSPTDGQMPYNVKTTIGAANSITILQPPTQYYATGGKVRIWAR